MQEAYEILTDPVLRRVYDIGRQIEDRRIFPNPTHPQKTKSIDHVPRVRIRALFSIFGNVLTLGS